MVKKKRIFKKTRKHKVEYAKELLLEEQNLEENLTEILKKKKKISKKDKR